jgi:hypothetical protein
MKEHARFPSTKSGGSISEIWIRKCARFAMASLRIKATQLRLILAICLQV